jgi:hypothetical protein
MQLQCNCNAKSTGQRSRCLKEPAQTAVRLAKGRQGDEALDRLKIFYCGAAGSGGSDAWCVMGTQVSAAHT